MKPATLIRKSTEQVQDKILRPLLDCYAELAMTCGKALGQIASSTCASCMKAEAARQAAQELLELTQKHSAQFQRTEDKLDKNA